MTTKENIIAALKFYKPEFSKFGVQNIGLFGSYVRNEQSDKSDIDLLIDFDPDKESFDNYMAVYDMFENIFKNEKSIIYKNEKGQIFIIFVLPVAQMKRANGFFDYEGVDKKTLNGENWIDITRVNP
jgi:predicted nucleotidyltransferase